MKQYKNEIKLIPDSSFQVSKVNSSETAANYARQFYHADIELYESFFIILLDVQHNTIGWAKIGQGGVAMCPVDVKIIAKYAIDCLASAVILVHNHPSGNLRPSDQDVSVTKKIKDGLKCLDVQVLDHIILTKEKHYSFVDEGIIF